MREQERTGQIPADVASLPQDLRVRSVKGSKTQAYFQELAVRGPPREERHSERLPDFRDRPPTLKRFNILASFCQECKCKLYVVQGPCRRLVRCRKGSELIASIRVIRRTLGCQDLRRVRLVFRKVVFENFREIIFKVFLVESIIRRALLRGSRRFASPPSASSARLKRLFGRRMV
jgi:hypothetical protein